jgi:hypothetical protein
LKGNCRQDRFRIRDHIQAHRAIKAAQSASLAPSPSAYMS